MRAYIAFTRRPEKRIDYRMNEHIRIGMAEKPVFPGKLHASENELSPLRDAMGIIPETYPEIIHCQQKVIRESKDGTATLCRAAV